MKTQSKETQVQLNPQTALQLLVEGNKRFVNNLKANRNLMQQVNETSDAQYPFATILSCMDSRTSAELIFDKGLGDIFSIRIAGNILNDDILGSMEFATKLVGSKIILILGHTKCGAIIGACNDVKMGALTKVLDKIKPAIDAEKTIESDRNGSNEDFVDKVTINNIQLVIEQIKSQSEIIATLEKDGEIKIIGGVYNVTNGEVKFIN